MQLAQVNLDLLRQRRQMPADRLRAKAKRIDLEAKRTQTLIDLRNRGDVAKHLYLVVRDGKRQQFITQRGVLDQRVFLAEPGLQLLDVKRVDRQRRILAAVIKLARNLEDLAFALA